MNTKTQESQISEQEARLTLSAIEAGVARGDFGDQDFSSLAISNLKELIAEYQLKRSDSTDTLPSEKSTKAIDPSLFARATSIALLAEESETAKYPKDHLKRSVKFEDLLKQKDSQSLSKMNFGALLKSDPFGSIEPSCPGVLFIDQELAIPHPTGKIVDLGFLEFYLSSSNRHSNRNSAELDKDHKEAHKINFPRKATIIPMPLAALLQELKNPATVSVPCEFDPAVWRINPWQTHGLNYSIAENKQVILLDSAKFEISEVEQEYWRKVLPLPAALIQKVTTEPEALVEWLVSYLSFKKQAELSNFRYVCNDHFGDFILTNKEFLPLIVSELKVGHCEILSWYLAGLLRSFGRPAWLASGFVTAKDETAGDSFNGSCKHTVVITINHKKELVQIDPSALVDIDSAFHPKIMTQEIVSKLQKQFQSAKTINAKAKVLRDFKQKIPDLRKEAESDQTVRKDNRAMASNYFEAFATEASSQLRRNSVYQRALSLNWKKFGEQFSIEEFMERVEALNSAGQFGVFHYRYFVGENFELLNKHRSLREHLAYVAKTFCEFEIQQDDSFDAYNKIENSKNQRLINSIPCGIYSGVHSANTNAAYYLDRAIIQQPEIYLCNKSDSQSNNTKMELLQELLLNKINTCQALTLADQHAYSNKFMTYIKQARSSLGLITLSYDTRAVVKEAFGGNFSNWPEFTREQVLFELEMYESLRNSDYRARFLNKIGNTQEWYDEVIRYFILNENELPKHVLQYVPRNSVINEGEENYAKFYIPTQQQLRIRSYLKKQFQKLDLKPSQIKTSIDGLHRPYSPGDDLRLMDWNAFARFQKPFVRSLPYKARDLANPLHVYFCYYGWRRSDGYDLISKRKSEEVIKFLQTECLTNNRLIYLSSDFCTSYFKVDPKISAKKHLDQLFTTSKRSVAINFISNNTQQMPKNILYISKTYNKILAMKYLYGKRSDLNLHTIYLNEPELRIFPLVSEDWVRDGDS
jgi:hypothetical protein